MEHNLFEMQSAALAKKSKETTRCDTSTGVSLGKQSQKQSGSPDLQCKQKIPILSQALKRCASLTIGTLTKIPNTVADDPEKHEMKRTT
jgi:hypothetical protein